MSFISVEHPTDANAAILFNSDELVFITANLHSMSGKPALGFVFKGDRKSVEFGYESVEDRDKVYKAVLETLKPQKAYLKRVN